jgi:hypothetical protein
MKVLATTISFLALFLLCGGCSKEEPPAPPKKKFKVVKPIDKTELEKAKTTAAAEEQKPETEAKEGEEGKTAALEPEPSQAPEEGSSTKEPGAEEMAGYYMAKKGENLSGIAARADVYKDSLKWPILYRLNMDRLSTVPEAKDFPETELPEGLRLKIVSADEKKENLEKRLDNLWVVNVISDTTHKEINPTAIRLMKNGYPVYIARARVKGKDWLRLRVGFFRSKNEANIEAKKIMTMVKLTNSWVAKIDEKEFKEFGGY